MPGDRAALPPHEWGRGEGTAVRTPAEASGGTSPIDSFILDFPPPERSGRKSLPLTSLNLQYFAIQAARRTR